MHTHRRPVTRADKRRAPKNSFKTRLVEAAQVRKQAHAFTALNSYFYTLD
jgi:hypothetical protein